MEEQFVLIATAADIYEGEIIRGMLEENGIEVTLINKKDSEFLIGEVEVYVPADQADNSRDILKLRDEE